MHLQEKGDQLPSLNNPPGRKKSSLRSLQEIQARRSAGSRSSRSRQGILEQQQQQVSKEPMVTMDMIDFKAIGDRLRGKSYLDGDINMYHTKQGDSLQGSKLQYDEKSQILHEGLRKKSPSDIIKRNSQPMTPKSKGMIVPPLSGTESANERMMKFASSTQGGVRQSFKIQTLAPLDNNALPNLMSQTARLNSQESNRQIGPLFNQGTNSIQILNPGSGNMTSRRNLVGGSKRQSFAASSNHEKFRKAWEKNKASTFQFANSQPKEVSDFLQQIIQEPVSLMFQKPQDLDSTESLDSFLDTIYLMIDENICDFNEQFQQRLHLATGMRTESCEDFLYYFAQLQTRNKLLINAVQFFNEYLTKISQLEGDKIEREKQVNQLILDKEELFLTKYDLERKLADISSSLKQAHESEKEAGKQVKHLQKKLEAKVAECESLVFRIKHMEDMSQMLDPPGTQSSLIKFVPDSPQVEAHLDNSTDQQIALRLNGTQSQHSVNNNNGDQERLRTLEAANKHLETELQLLRTSLNQQQEASFKDNVDHFVRIQELFNKAQIENKSLRSTNKKLESRYQAKDRLVTLLEGKVTQVMVEKEDIIISLKSELVLLKAQIQENEQNFEKRLAVETAKFMKEFQADFTSQEKKMKDEMEQMVREKAEQGNRNNQLQNEIDQMAADFSKYRDDITKKDIEKEKSINELQKKLKESGQLNESQTRQLQDRIESFKNQNLVQAKQIGILELKLRLIRDSVETLFRQKMFIVENIERSRNELVKESAAVEANMMSENDNKEYLISVKKAVKISQTMVDIGLQAISKVLQVVAFLKIDEIRNMIASSNLDIIDQQNDKSAIKESQQQEIEKLNLLFQTEDIADGEQKFQNKRATPQPTQALKIQKYIQIDNQADGESQEEHYYNNCPIELSSILSKVLGEALVIIGSISDQSQLPIGLMRLVNQGLRKSDPSVEQEIFKNYLQPVKKMIEDRLKQLSEKQIISRDKITTISNKDIAKTSSSNDENKNQRLQSAGLRSRLRNLSKMSQDNQLQEVSNTQGPGSTISGKIEGPVLAKGSSGGIGGINLLEDSNQKRRISSIDSRLTSAKRSPIKQLQNAQDISLLEQKVESMKIQLKEQKLKQKDLQLQLASRIVNLEDQLDELKVQQAQELSELELLQKEEITKTKSGIHQRELELIQRAGEFQARAEQSDLDLQQAKLLIETLQSEISRLQEYQIEFDRRIYLQEEEMSNYKDNVQTFVNLRVSQRNMFGITLEVSNQNVSLINEAMLKFYLNKCLKIDKEKFRIISQEEMNFTIEKQNKQAFQNNEEHVTIHQVIIEIIDDQENVDRYFQQFKTQIREGTSILYDLQPLYLSINLGQCGIKREERFYLRDYHLIKRTGQILKEEDYVISILRHKQDPLSFKVIAASADLRDEFILDLSARDLYELTEGQHSLLEASEPTALIDTILENLTLVVNKQTGMKVLGCEHKLFFNQLFINNHVPSIYNQQNVSHSQKRADQSISNTQVSVDSQQFRNTSFRNSQILSQVVTNTNKISQVFKEKLYQEVDCQTEKDQVGSFTSLLNMAMFRTNNNNQKFQELGDEEIFNTTYMGYQRVGKSVEIKIRIDEGVKTGTYVVTFEEIRTKDRCQICVLDSMFRDKYVIHSECMRFQHGEEESHLMLLTFEKFQADGILIKMHDLKFGASEEFFIVKKSNGQYSRLSRSAGLEIIVQNGKEHEELRNLIFDLTFTLTVPSSQVLYANMAAMENMMTPTAENDEQNLIPLIYIPEIKRNGRVMENQKQFQIEQMIKNASLQMPAVARFMNDPYQLPSGVLLQKHERGELIYRNIFTIRCCFERGTEEIHESLISFYLKKEDQISVEVFLFKESEKMSIASQVTSKELFGINSQDLSFTQKVDMLNQMMEKLYIYSQRSQFHLKVENEAPPISQVIELKTQELILAEKNQQNSTQTVHAFRRSNTNLKRSNTDQGQPVIQIIPPRQLKVEEIEQSRDQYLNPDKCIHIKSYAQFNERYFDYNVFFIKKLEKEQTPPVAIQPSPNTKKNKSTKKPIERQVSMTNNLDDLVDYDNVYIEISDQEHQNYSTVLSIQTITNMIMTNSLEFQKNWQMVQSRDKYRFVEYLKSNTRVDEVKQIMIVEAYSASNEYIMQSYINEVGGSYIRREENTNKAQTESKLVDKKLLINKEVDMAEFSYDVKLYQVFDKNKVKKALSYSLEILSLNEPDLIYRYNYALQEQSSFIHSPIHVSLDVINLIENPHSHLRENEEQDRKQEMQQLMQKYMDNSFVLVVNEQIFPHQISFCIYELNSRLHWSYTFDPSTADPDYQEKMNKTTLSGRWNIEIGQLSILDSGTAERMLALIMNDILDHSNQQEILSQDFREDNWSDLGDTEALRYDLIQSKKIGEDIIICLSKMGVDCLKVEVKNSNYIYDPINNSHVSKQDDLNNVVRFAVNANSRNKFISKLLKLKDQDVNRLLMLTCEIRDEVINVKVIQMINTGVLLGDSGLDQLNPKILYQFTFKEKRHVKNDALKTKIIDKEHLEEMIAEVFTSGQNGMTNQSVVERSSTLYKIITKKNIQKPKLSVFQDNISVTQRRLIAASNLNSDEQINRQKLILHRKTFFDETHQKLIIVTVSIMCNLARKKGHGSAQLALRDVEIFNLLINEPETQKNMNFDVFIRNCFLEEELLNGVDLKNISHLKKMAKLVIEERAIIKRISKDVQLDSHSDNNLYSVEINLGNIQTQALPILDQVTNQQYNQNHPDHSNRDLYLKTENLTSEDSDRQNETDQQQQHHTGFSPRQSSVGNSSNQRVGETIVVNGQSVIEEENSQEEYEDSPDFRKDQEKNSFQESIEVEENGDDDDDESLLNRMRQAEMRKQKRQAYCKDDDLEEDFSEDDDNINDQQEIIDVDDGGESIIAER